MEANKILSADLLDILFEGKNKEYGAYELRKTYNKRISLALGIMVGIALLIFVISFVAKSINTDDTVKKQDVKDVTLSEVVNEPPPPPPPPPPKLPPPPPIATIQFTPPKVVKDEEVIKPPPENKELDEKKVDVKTEEGKKDEGIVAPPVEDKGTQVVEAPPKKAEDEDRVFTKVEIDASFPGGEGGWTRYVTKAIQSNIDELTEAGESGTCRVRFIVSKDGSVSDVEALTLKGTKLAEIAVNAIRKGPKWTPAQQNGRSVNAYREQPVTFTITE
ncbi:MAG: energy transducer TonB [Chitinophagaceae bacterium]|nr:energy transducer TonB [Chitinophagaceae bacterium]